MERKQPEVPAPKSMTLTKKVIETLGPLADLDTVAETLPIEKVLRYALHFF